MVSRACFTSASRVPLFGLQGGKIGSLKGEWSRLIGVSVDTHHHSLTRLLSFLKLVGTPGNGVLEEAPLDRPGRATQLLHLGHQVACACFDRIGERFDVVAARQRVHHIRDAGLEAQDLLSPKRQGC